MRRKEQGERRAAGRAMSHAQKFGPGLDPLEYEKQLTTIQPLTSEATKNMYRIANDLLASNQLGETERKALKMWKLQLAATGADGAIRNTVKVEFLHDFWKWLLGRGKQEDHDKCFWQRQKLTDDAEVCAYVESFVKKMWDWRTKMAVMKIRRPTGINQHYLYFKYIVRGEQQESEFLSDWQVFLDEFKEARVAPHFQKVSDREENVHPHETAPYGRLRAGISENDENGQSERRVKSLLSGYDDGGDGPSSSDSDSDESGGEDENPKDKADRDMDTAEDETIDFAREIAASMQQTTPEKQTEKLAEVERRAKEREEKLTKDIADKKDKDDAQRQIAEAKEARARAEGQREGIVAATKQALAESAAANTRIAEKMETIVKQQATTLENATAAVLNATREMPALMQQTRQMLASVTTRLDQITENKRDGNGDAAATTNELKTAATNLGQLAANLREAAAAAPTPQGMQQAFEVGTATMRTELLQAIANTPKETQPEVLQKQFQDFAARQEAALQKSVETLSTKQEAFLKQLKTGVSDPNARREVDQETVRTIAGSFSGVVATQLQNVTSSINNANKGIGDLAAQIRTLHNGTPEIVEDAVAKAKLEALKNAQLTAEAASAAKIAQMEQQVSQLQYNLGHVQQQAKASATKQAADAEQMLRDQLSATYMEQQVTVQRLRDHEERKRQQIAAELETSRQEIARLERELQRRQNPVPPQVIRTTAPATEPVAPKFTVTTAPSPAAGPEPVAPKFVTTTAPGPTAGPEPVAPQMIRTTKPAESAPEPTPPRFVTTTAPGPTAGPEPVPPQMIRTTKPAEAPEPVAPRFVVTTAPAAAEGPEPVAPQMIRTTKPAEEAPKTPAVKKKTRASKATAPEKMPSELHEATDEDLEQAIEAHLKSQRELEAKQAGKEATESKKKREKAKAIRRNEEEDESLTHLELMTKAEVAPDIDELIRRKGAEGWSNDRFAQEVKKTVVKKRK